MNKSVPLNRSRQEQSTRNVYCQLGKLRMWFINDEIRIRFTMMRIRIRFFIPSWPCSLGDRGGAARCTGWLRVSPRNVCRNRVWGYEHLGIEKAFDCTHLGTCCCWKTMNTDTYPSTARRFCVVVQYQSGPMPAETAIFTNERLRIWPADSLLR